MMELYHNDMSTCAQKVRLVLAEKGLSWQAHHLNLRAGDTLRPEYLALNPAGVVPTLVDCGQVVIESTVINEYLDDAYADPPLRPANPVGRAKMRLWTKQLDEGVHAATAVISQAIAFRFQHLQKPPTELTDFLERIPDPARRTRTRELIEKGIQSPMFTDALTRYCRLLDDMERTLAGSTWLAADSYSLADAAYTPYMARLEHLQLSRLIDDRPLLRRWVARVKQRQSYADAIEAWLNPAYLSLMREKGDDARPHIEGALRGT